jgi:hypothetical protein
MIVKARFCQSLIENELQPLSKIPFTLHGETRPSKEELSLNPINIYYHSEPDEYFGTHSWIKENYHLFDYVLTWNYDLDIPNAIFTPFGTSAFHDKLNDHINEGTYQQKENKVTFIRGSKHAPVKGHDLRHELWNRKHEITNIKTEFYDRTNPEYASNPEEDIAWFAQRKNIFSSPLYHICIENTSHENYFTEKIIDCFLFRTIPIYFGCPNIGDFFDKTGIVTFDSIDELIFLTEYLDEQFYESKIVSIHKNQLECLKYLNLGRTIRNTITRIFESKYPDFLKLI